MGSLIGARLIGCEDGRIDENIPVEAALHVCIGCGGIAYMVVWCRTVHTGFPKLFFFFFG